MACITRKHVYFVLLNTYNGLRVLPLSRVVNNARNNLRCSIAAYCSGAAVPEKATETEPAHGKISKAMQSYLKKAQDHEIFLKEQNEEYAKGKRFLARIMGENPEKFDQQKIDEAIEYLFPSALYDKKARPCFKNPEILFPKQKQAQFDYSGRPFNFLFYTLKPNYVNVLHECASYYDMLNKKLLKLGPDAVPPKKSIDLTGTKWLSKKDLEEMLIENLLNSEYEKFIESMERLKEHPYSFEAADFIVKYRRPEASSRQAIQLPPKKELDTGETVVTVDRCRKKRCFASVKVIHPGTGKILINGKEMIDFFPEVYNREQVKRSGIIFVMDSEGGVGKKHASLKENMWKKQFFKNQLEYELLA